MSDPDEANDLKQVVWHLDNLFLDHEQQRAASERESARLSR